MNFCNTTSFPGLTLCHRIWKHVKTPSFQVLMLKTTLARKSKYVAFTFPSIFFFLWYSCHFIIFNVHTNHLGTLFKYRSWFSSSGVRLESLSSHRLLGGTDVEGPRTTCWPEISQTAVTISGSRISWASLTTQVLFCLIIPFLVSFPFILISYSSLELDFTSYPETISESDFLSPRKSRNF